MYDKYIDEEIKRKKMQINNEKDVNKKKKLEKNMDKEIFENAKLQIELKRKKCPAGFGPSAIPGEEICCSDIKSPFTFDKQDGNNLKYGSCKKDKGKAIQLGLQKIAQKQGTKIITGTASGPALAAATTCLAAFPCALIVGIAVGVIGAGFSVYKLRKLWKDRKKSAELSKVGSELIEELKIIVEKNNDQAAAQLLVELNNKIAAATKISIFGMEKKMQDLFTIMDGTRRYLEQLKKKEEEENKGKPKQWFAKVENAQEKAKKIIGAVAFTAFAATKFKKGKEKKMGKPKMSPCNEYDNINEIFNFNFTENQKKKKKIKLAVKCDPIENLLRINKAIEIIKKWSAVESFKKDSVWKTYIIEWFKKQDNYQSVKNEVDTNIENRYKTIAEKNPDGILTEQQKKMKEDGLKNGLFNKAQNIYWKEYDIDTKKVSLEIDCANKDYETAKKNLKKETIIIDDTLEKRFIKKLRDIKDNCNFNQTHEIKSLYDIFLKYKHSPLDVTMPKEDNYMYHFVYYKLEGKYDVTEEANPTQGGKRHNRKRRKSMRKSRRRKKRRTRKRRKKRRKSMRKSRRRKKRRTRK
tara:strand:- start:644 stop:2380 length:1737 start_codon:yes stop_codon:yes gene_type:complete